MLCSGISTAFKCFRSNQTFTANKTFSSLKVRYTLKTNSRSSKSHPKPITSLSFHLVAPGIVASSQRTLSSPVCTSAPDPRIECIATTPTSFLISSVTSAVSSRLDTRSALFWRCHLLRTHSCVLYWATPTRYRTMPIITLSSTSVAEYASRWLCRTNRRAVFLAKIL